jgi:hypothetical protein
MAQGRAIRRIVSLFDSIEDLIAENDRRHQEDNEDHTFEQVFRLSSQFMSVDHVAAKIDYR